MYDGAMIWLAGTDGAEVHGFVHVQADGRTGSGTTWPTGGRSMA